jgi:DNA-binding NarL/FixJ family response regulator
MRVLTVDDEPLARTALAQILSARPDVERFDSANDPFEAQEHLARDTYDIMPLDVSMPELRPRTPHPPRAASASHPFRRVRHRPRRAGSGRL